MLKWDALIADALWVTSDDSQSTSPEQALTHTHTLAHTHTHAPRSLSCFIHWPWRICAGSLTHAYLHWTHTHSPTQRPFSKGYCVWVCVCLAVRSRKRACVKVTPSEADHLFMPFTDCRMDIENTWTFRQTTVINGTTCLKAKNKYINTRNEHRRQLRTRAAPRSYSEPTITHSPRTLQGLFLARHREEKGQNLLLGFKHIFHPDYCCSILFRE